MSPCAGIGPELRLRPQAVRGVSLARRTFQRSNRGSPAGAPAGSSLDRHQLAGWARFVSSGAIRPGRSKRCNMRSSSIPITRCRTCLRDWPSQCRAGTIRARETAQHVSPFVFALVHTGLGEWRTAVDALEQTPTWCGAARRARCRLVSAAERRAFGEERAEILVASSDCLGPAPLGRFRSRPTGRCSRRSCHDPSVCDIEPRRCEKHDVTSSTVMS